ncbi:hypothetical protein ACWEOH_18035 [Agromyces sp. NPDC004153]
MTLTALRDDALSSTEDGFALRLSLPWIRSLPLASLDSLQVIVDGEVVHAVVIALGGRLIDPAAAVHERGWWFLQDRIVIRGRRMLDPGAHDVSVSFRLAIPYLQAGPDGPLTLPFHVDRILVLDAPASAASASRDVA